MPARTGLTARATLRAALCVVAILAATAQSASPDQEPVEPRVAIEKARALERDGLPDEAYVYLYELVGTHEDLARDATVLIELSRLSPTADESVELLEAAVEAARSAETVVRARRDLGDYLYARGSYMEAAEQYASAAGRAGEPERGFLLVKRADSILSAGDAGAAVDEYRELKERGKAPDEATPWAALGLGRALIVKGDYLGAAVEFETFADTYVEHEARARALSGAAEARAAAGDFAAARSALNLLVAEYPGTHEAVLARQDLRTLPADSMSVVPEPASGAADDAEAESQGSTSGRGQDAETE